MRTSGSQVPQDHLPSVSGPVITAVETVPVLQMRTPGPCCWEPGLGMWSWVLGAESRLLPSSQPPRVEEGAPGSAQAWARWLNPAGLCRPLWSCSPGPAAGADRRLRAQEPGQGWGSPHSLPYPSTDLTLERGREGGSPGDPWPVPTDRSCPGAGRSLQLQPALAAAGACPPSLPTLAPDFPMPEPLLAPASEEAGLGQFRTAQLLTAQNLMSGCEGGQSRGRFAPYFPSPPPGRSKPQALRGGCQA